MKLNIVERTFFKLCEKIKTGTLHVTAPDGSRHTFGTGAPVASVEIHDWKVVTSLMSRGDIGFGETYADGLWDSPDIEALIMLVFANDDTTGKLARGNHFQRILFMLKDRVMRRNSRAGSRENISAHYDVGNDFYQLWLDDSMTYSSAFYGGEEMALEAAQKRKYDRLLDIVKPAGERVLEIGCGWGLTAIFCIKKFGCFVWCSPFSCTGNTAS